uniref:Uncharacterized protein n=1 Tax=Romanomermis culicivorax TaxID=13658 RepID=A0A915IPL4_ROMCU
MSKIFNLVNRKTLFAATGVTLVVAGGVGEQCRQLNDSSFIVSFLRTFFVDPSVSLDDIKSFYPIFVSEDEKSKIFDNDNKYFVMFNEKLTSKMDINARR